MSASLPRPSASSRAGMSGRTTARGKLAAATQWQREREKLLSVVAKSRELAIDKTHVHLRTAPATPSSVERAHRMLQHSAMKQVDVPLRASKVAHSGRIPPEFRTELGFLYFEKPERVPCLTGRHTLLCT